MHDGYGVSRFKNNQAYFLKVEITFINGNLKFKKIFLNMIFETR